MFITKLPSAHKLTVRERRAGERCLFFAESFDAACKRHGVKPSRLRVKPAWAQVAQEALELGPALRAEAAAAVEPAADPAIDELLQEIERRSPPAVLTPTVPPVPDRSCATGPLMSEKGKPDTENRAEDQLTELEARTQALFAEKAMTQEEWINKKFPPVFDEPVTVDGIVGLDPELKDKDPELHATVTRPSMWKIITAGYEAADRERHQRAYHVWQQKHYESGVGGGSYCEETPTMAAARRAAQQ
jgi:hypothetical protein